VRDHGHLLQTYLIAKQIGEPLNVIPETRSTTSRRKQVDGPAGRAHGADWAIRGAAEPKNAAEVVNWLKRTARGHKTEPRPEAHSYTAPPPNSPGLFGQSLDSIAFAEGYNLKVFISKNLDIKI